MPKSAALHQGHFDALAFDPDDTRDPRSKAFIPREGSRKRGLEIAFDPEKHKSAFQSCLRLYTCPDVPAPALHLIALRGMLNPNKFPSHLSESAEYINQWTP
jgi:hypothetical protein